MITATRGTRQALLLILLAGCGGGNPAPRLDMARALVCGVPGASFDVHGIHLQKSHLELQRVETVVGVPVSEPPLVPAVQLAGDSLHASLDGAPLGVYDVTAVAGPERWTNQRGLAILPPPTVSAEMPPAFCDAQSAQVLSVRGAGFAVISGSAPTVTIFDDNGSVHFSSAGDPGECVPAVASVLDGVQLCNAVSLTLPPGELDPGSYYAAVQNPDPLACASTEMVLFNVAPPPAVQGNQTTAQLCQGGGRIVIVGSGFQDAATVALGGVAPATTTFVNQGEIIADFGYVPAFTPGQQLSLIVANSDGCRSAQLDTVSVAAGPVLLAVDPPLVLRSLRTPLQLQLSSLTAPVTVSIVSGGMTTTLTATANGNRADAEVPPNLAAGVYDVVVSDGSGCGAQLKGALTIVDQATLSLQSLRPAFGVRTQAQRLTIAGAIAAGARAWLAPLDGSTAVPMPAQLDAGALHAVAPANLAPGIYGVAVVNPDGKVGFLNDVTAPFGSYQAVDAVPQITHVTPQVLPSGCSGCSILIEGSGFGASSSAGATCWAPGSATPLPSPPPFAGIGSLDTQIVVDGSSFATLPHGTFCKLFVRNGAVFAEASDAVVVANGLSPIAAADPTLPAGPSLSTVRRAPAVAVAEAEPGSRFLYALGGDGGTLGSPRADGEFAPLGPAGLGSWSPLLRADLPSATTLAGAVASGRFVYLVGGYDGTAALSRVARAQVLDPTEAPQLVDLAVAFDTSGHGLGGGASYYYRLSARFAVPDPIDPNGESLASPPIAVTLPPLDATFDLTVQLSPGVTPGRQLAGWRLYRGTAPDQINRYVDLPLSAVSFTDDDTLLSASQSPLPLGALGRFTANGLPQLNSARAGAAVTLVPDAVPGRGFLYAGFGWDGATLPASYEVLQLDSGAPGAQFTQAALGTGRWLAAAWAGTPERNSKLAQRYVYFGQGTSNTTLTNVAGGDSVAEIDVGQIAAAGALTPVAGIAPTVPFWYGYGAFAGGDSLVMVGGASLQTSTLVWRAPFAAAAPQPDPWVSQPLLPQVTFLPGVAADGPYLFVVGGGPSFVTAAAATSLGLF